ncbi:MAG TPA: TonB-dependent receptor, partial [Vicinamibacterales bacterium]
VAITTGIAVHDARFTQYLFQDSATGTAVDVSGDQLPLSPRWLASVGVLCTPQHGFNSTIVARYVGARYLDEENSARVGGYTTLDATLGYRTSRYLLAFEARNLTNRRPPVTSSEFGSQSFYLLAPRMLWLRLAYTGL